MPDFEKLLEPEYRWPRKGDRLLRGFVNREEGVEFANDDFLRHALLWDGYFHAAEALVDAAFADPVQRNALVYPILFNYRHATELAMKWIIARYGRFVPVDEDTQHHDLLKLWRVCRAIIIDGGSGDDDALGVIDSVVKDFHDLDSTAAGFRYAVNKDGSVLKLRDGIFDLANIRDVMKSVSHFFDGVDGFLDAGASAAGW